MTTFTTDDRLQAEKIDEIELTDAQDAFYTFDDEHNNMFDDDDRMMFVEAYNQGQQAMKDKILTLLGGFK
jgi:hypothetical protein